MLTLAIIAFEEYSDYKKDQKIKQKHVEIATYIALPEESSFHEKIDHIREFIAAHSEININEEFYSIWRDHTKILDTFLAGIKKERDSFVPLECATRTTVMQDMYEHYGFDVRSIITYTLTTPSMKAHVSNDVLNPETNKWETQDGRYNMYWRNKAKRCGWDIISPENQKAISLEPYFYIAAAIDKKRNIRQSVYDSTKMSADTQITFGGKTGTFCQLVEKNCRNGFFPAK